MSVQDEVDDLDSGNAFMATMTSNYLEVELEAKMDILNELNLNRGVKIEENLLIDRRIETDAIRLRNIGNDGYISLIASPSTGTSYALQLPPQGPSNKDFLYWDNSNSRLEWIEFIAGNDITIGISNNQISINSTAIADGVTAIAEGDKIKDSDEDTRICVEENIDEDLIRFYTQGQQIATMGITGFDIGITNQLSIRADGSLKPATICDNDAPENSLYFNKNHLVYKEPSGCVRYLYEDNLLERIVLFKQQWTRMIADEKLWGSSAFAITNDVRYAPVKMCFLSKSSETASLSSFTPVQTPGNCNADDENDETDDEDNDDYSYLQCSWEDCSEIEVRKTLSCHDGNYTVKPFYSTNCENDDAKGVTLTGTSWTTLYEKLEGNVVLNIESEENHPTGTFVLSKRDASIDGAIFRPSHSPGFGTGCQLRVRWLANSFIEVRKTTNDYDGFYTFHDTLTMTSTKSYDITLSGTSWSTISSKLPKYRFVPIVAIHSDVTNAPSAVFALSKNKASNAPGKSQLSASPSPDNKRLRIRWLANNKIQIRKNTSNYDGLYSVVIH